MSGRWVGPAPSNCDLCNKSLQTEFVDARLGPAGPAPGRWAICCWSCFQRFGVGLGTGKGQHYRGNRTDGFQFIK